MGSWRDAALRTSVMAGRSASVARRRLCWREAMLGDNNGDGLAHCGDYSACGVKTCSDVGMNMIIGILKGWGDDG